jgi:hypothetical protein
MLGRVGARWALQAPVAAPADAEAVTAALRALDEVLIARFREAAVGTGSGATVSVEADQQHAESGGLVRRTLVQRVEVVGSAGPETAIVRCTGELRDPSGTITPLWQFLGDARSEALARVPAGASALVSRVASGVARGDVAGVSWSTGVRGATFRRELEAWSRRTPKGDAPATPEEVSRLGRVVELLTAARADNVLDTGASFEPAVTVTLEDLAGDPLEVVELALLAPAEGEPAVAARTSGLVRVYAGPAARPIFDWLVEHAREQRR